MQNGGNVQKCILLNFLGCCNPIAHLHEPPQGAMVKFNSKLWLFCLPNLRYKIYCIHALGAVSRMLPLIATMHIQASVAMDRHMSTKYTITKIHRYCTHCTEWSKWMTPNNTDRIVALKKKRAILNDSR